MTVQWLADKAWLGGENLAENVLLSVEGGVIRQVEANSAHPAAKRINGVTLPGVVNAHSHAFHRRLRGRTHQQGGDFWVWREMMYETAAELTPDSYRALATDVYREMLEAGFTAVGEFHYLHHQPGGVPYDDPNEMGHALIEAATEAGIRINLLDAGYLRGGVGGTELSPVQLRFSDGSVEAWLERVSGLVDRYEGEPSVRIGIAPHSVRALTPEDLRKVAELRDSSLRCHIHVSEQLAENSDTFEATGMTPVQLLGDCGLLGEWTTAVHATHLTEEDIAALGESGTGVCYCATTERELADGLGPSGALRNAGVPLSIGTDSHAVIDPFEEARGIELHNRLATGRRGELSASELMAAATSGGSNALGFSPNEIAVGAPADFTVVSTGSRRTQDVAAEGGLQQLLYTATNADVSAVFVAGKQVV